MSEDHEPIIPDSATPAEAQIIASLAVVRVQLTNALNVGADHEDRIRILESRKHLSPAMLWGTLGAIATLVTTVAIVIQAWEGMH